MNSIILLEIVCEELPARFIAPLTAKLRRYFEAKIQSNRALYPMSEDSDVEIFSTPRRLAISIPINVDQYRPQPKTFAGPPIEKCFDTDGRASKAMLGFCKRQGIELDGSTIYPSRAPIFASYDGERWDFTGNESEHSTVVLRNVNSRLQIFQIVEKKITDAFSDVVVSLPELIKSLNTAVDRSMVDGRGIKFPRPLERILIMLDAQAWEIPILSLISGAYDINSALKLEQVSTIPHRFSMRARIPTADYYQQANQQSSVLVNRLDRKLNIRQEINTMSMTHVSQLIDFERDRNNAKLLDEVVDLVENPQVIVCEFPEKYLKLPERLISSVLVKHQRYFWLGKQESIRESCKFFVVINLADRSTNGKIAHENAIVGHQKVVIPRLEDALFSYQTDIDTGLDALKSSLDTITLHEKLGSYAAKNQRIMTAAQEFSWALLPSFVKSFAYLRADRGSLVVNEFTDLEGYMLELYWLKDHASLPISGKLFQLIGAGITDEYWQGVSAHFKANPTEKLSDASKYNIFGAFNLPEVWYVFLVDRILTLFESDHIGIKFTSSKDPYGLRKVIREIARAGFIFSVLQNIDSPEYTSLETIMSSLFDSSKKNFSPKSNPREDKLRDFGEAILSMFLADFDIQNKVTITDDTVGIWLENLSDSYGLHYVTTLPASKKATELHKRAEKHI